MEKSTHTVEYANLRQELRTARERASLTQRELAIRLDVPHSWVAKVETGERRIDLVEFGWFISACDTDPIPIAEQLFRQILRTQKRHRTQEGRTK